MKRNIVQTLTSLSENGFIRLQNQMVRSFDTHGLFVRENVKNQLKKFYKQNDKFSYFLSNNLQDDVERFITRFSKFDSIINSFALVYKQSSPVQSMLNRLEHDDQIDQLPKDTSSKDVNSPYLNQLSSVNQCLALFCNRELSLNYFHWLQSQRHRFWRKVI